MSEKQWQRLSLDCFQKSLHPCALDESSLSNGRVKILKLQRNFCCFHFRYKWNAMSTDDKVFIKENSMNLLASVSNGVGTF